MSTGVETNGTEGKTSIVHEEVSAADDDANQLNDLGYKQEFKRNMGLLLQIAFPFIGMAILPNWLVGFGPSLASGGPSSLFWGWVGGYMYAAALLTANMTVSWNLAQLIIGIASVLRNEVIENTGAYVGVYIIMTFVCTGAGYLGMTFTNVMNHFIAFWLVATTFVFVIGVLCLSPARNDASWVFLQFTNETGYDNPAIVFFLGLLQAGWTTIGYESGITISENTKDAARTGPRGLMLCITAGLVQGFLITLAALFTIQDLDGLIGASLPISEYFMQTTRNPQVAAFFLATMIVSQAGSFANTAIAFTRLTWSMARDNALPYSKFFYKLDRDVPVRLVGLQIVLMVVLILPVFGTMVYWRAILSTTIISYNCAYGMPLLTRLLFVRNKMPLGPYNMGRWGVVVNAIALLWIIFLAVVLCFPSTVPTDGTTFNYSCVMLGAVIIFTVVYWIISGRHKYKGPDAKELGEFATHGDDSDDATKVQ
ncbi:hypothetical protein DM01DRAFT_1385992 [Hesseltinella vesiculosa]|uniref:Amino acid transporter n=1 Tax=Hesseltinella vesiculosa TaxID=101127 RepID=A0A1X2G7W1_9FUNG|nr:hypothetical protein DM01DRAFT_1385992 [Hesseltinella vesiculosa]